MTGASQTGRYCRQFLYAGFHQDEHDRVVVEGLWPHITAARLPINMRCNCLPLWVDQGDGGVVGSTKD